MQNECCACARARACARGLPSLANGAGLFLTVCVRRSAKLRMSQGSTYTRAPITLFLRDSWVQIPPPAFLSILITLTRLEKERT